jgi:hypothetical protein
MNKRKLSQKKLLPAIISLLVAHTLFFGNLASAYTVNVAPNGDIQGAINSVSAAGGGTVNITHGSATISTTLTVPSNVTINGAGNPTTSLGLSSSITVGIASVTTSWSNITIQNIKISGAGTSVSQAGIVLNAPGAPIASAGNMSNVQVLNTGNDAVQLACDNGNVTSCNFHNSGNSDLQHCFYFLGGSSTIISGCNLTYSVNGSGFHLNNWYPVNGGESENNTTSNNGQNGHSFTASTSNAVANFTINACTASNNGFGMGTGGNPGIGFYLGTGPTVTSGCVCENCTTSGNANTGYLSYGGYDLINDH